MCGLAIDRRVVLATDRALRAHRAAFFRRDRADAAAGGQDPGALDHRRAAALLEEGHQRLADSQFGDRLRHIQAGIGDEGLGGGLHRLLVARRESAQRVLDAMPKLAEDVAGDVVRILAAEIDADALRTDQAHDLLDALHQRGRRVVEQQVRLVEEEHQARLVEVPDLRQLLEQFRQQPEQEARIQLRLHDQLLGRHHVDDATAGRVDREEIAQFESRLAEERARTRVLQAEQRALHRGNRGGRHQAVLGRDVLRVLRHVVQHGAQIRKVQQQQAFLVGHPEHDVQHARLHLVQFHQARQQDRPHFADRGTQRMPVLAVDIPEHHRVGARLPLFLDAEQLQAIAQLVAHRRGLRQAGEVALDVRQEHRHAALAELLRQQHQRHALSGAGGAGDQAVAVGVARQQGKIARAAGDRHLGNVGHLGCASTRGSCAKATAKAGRRTSAVRMPAVGRQTFLYQNPVLL
ncbi:MAG: hypothetical protein OMOMHJEC_01242 [Xanthomonadales bacterium]|nr:hypothetical protein [Xanthomonadales bacterium]